MLKERATITQINQCKRIQKKTEPKIKKEEGDPSFSGIKKVSFYFAGKIKNLKGAIDAIYKGDSDNLKTSLDSEQPQIRLIKPVIKQ